MDGGILRERDLEIDLESGRVTNEDNKTDEHVSSNSQTNQVLERVNGLMGSDGLVNSSKFVNVAGENVGLLVDKSSEGEEDQPRLTFWGRNHIEGKQKKKNSKKPPKPPRPPKGPALDAADQKLVQEIADLAVRRRARIERIKALKKMRASKSSWSSSLSAMVVTILFCLIFIVQGICSRHHGSTSSQGSPQPALTGNEGLISIQLLNSSYDYEDHGSGFPRLYNHRPVEDRFAGSGTKK